MSDGSPSEVRTFARDTLETVAIVAAVGAVLFAVSGVWPPMVAIESGSMQPTLERGDLVVVTAEGRYGGPAADEHGVVTANASEGYGRLGGSGDVVVYDAPSHSTPIIHRAVFWVDDGENWYDRTNESYVDGADSCAELLNCPAPHAGYVTRGDNNDYYDQARGIASPVRPDWVQAKGQFHVPYLGELRLELQKLL
ncbi:MULTISPECIES: S26 family signal peptidase [unclassified Haloferax]|uniref:S26 family signal peptidase n=1 Tax=unclassified Haloferax TaxID=2625095 RepID=UPI000737C861|nr:MULTISPECIES: S26 family signal peptidase [unclassified Haloferax]MCO8266657.1 S26 family signal peptidase [Haloferax sp. AB510]